MPFVEQEEGYTEQKIDGKTVKVYKPRVEVTIKHLKTGREYLSDEEAKADVNRRQNSQSLQAKSRGNYKTLKNRQRISIRCRG